MQTIQFFEIFDNNITSFCRCFSSTFFRFSVRFGLYFTIIFIFIIFFVLLFFLIVVLILILIIVIIIVYKTPEKIKLIRKHLEIFTRTMIYSSNFVRLITVIRLKGWCWFFFFNTINLKYIHIKARISRYYTLLSKLV